MVGVQMKPRGKVIHSLNGKELRTIDVGNIACFTAEGATDININAQIQYEHLLFPHFIVGWTLHPMYVCYT